jgi:hypothetical protein
VETISGWKWSARSLAGAAGRGEVARREGACGVGGSLAMQGGEKSPTVRTINPGGVVSSAGSTRDASSKLRNSPHARRYALSQGGDCEHAR